MSNQGWQPIDTAPKDELILVGPPKRMGICAAMLQSGEGWVTETLSEWVSIYTPTHWMPLPAAPGATPAADERAPVGNERALTEKQRKEFMRRTSYISEADRDTRAAFVDEIARAALASAPVAGEAPPVAWFIDWPEEPGLGHYLAESPAETGRSRPLVFAAASKQESTPVSEEPVYAYRRKGLDDFVTCDRERFDELSAKPRLFETRIFYAAPQASPAADERDAKDSPRFMEGEQATYWNEHGGSADCFVERAESRWRGGKPYHFARVRFIDGAKSVVPQSRLQPRFAAQKGDGENP